LNSGLSDLTQKGVLRI